MFKTLLTSSLFRLGLGVIAFVIGNPTLTRAQSSGSRLDQTVSGTLAFLGCDVRPADVLVRARPFTHVSSDGSPTTGPNATRVERIVSPTVGPTGELAFVFDDLTPGTIYRIGIKLVGSSAQRCPRFGWNVSRDPLVVAGDDPLVIEGYAVRSQLEVLGPAIGGRNHEAWLGADSVDFTDPRAGTRRFRWRTSLPGVTGGVLQVSLEKFPRPGERAFDPCSGDTPGIVYSQAFPYASSRVGETQSEWVGTEPVDFSSLFQPGAIDDNTRLELELGRPFYVRVVPTIAGNPICDPRDGGLPSEAVLAKILLELLQSPPPSPGPAITIDKMFYNGPWINAEPNQSGERCYRLIRPHPVVWDPTKYGPFGYQTVWDFYLAHSGTASGPLGWWFCVSGGSGDDGWFESFVNSIGSAVKEFIDAVGQIVDFASHAWENIKEQVVAGVAAGLNEVLTPLNIECDTTCKAGLTFALETGMASMGIPPSLPNFEQLQQQGLDYLAAQAASQAGIPPDVADLTKDVAQKFVKKATEEMRSNYHVKGMPDWLAPDVLFDPAFMTMHVWGPNTPLTQSPLVIRNHHSIFLGGAFLLPKKLPTKAQPSLAVPMVLPPNIGGLPVAPSKASEYGKASWYKQKWNELKFKNGCYTLVLTALVPGDVIPLFNASFRTEDATACVK